MPNSCFSCTRGPDSGALPRKAARGGSYLLAGMLGTVVLAGSVSAAETSYTAGAGLNYKLDDNINVSSVAPISLAGWILDGFFKGDYATSHFTAGVDLELGFERYNHASVDSDNPDVQDPDPEDYNSDNQNLGGDIAYQWDRHALSLYGRYSRNSTLNTLLQDTGLGGRGTRTTITLGSAWQWQVTEKQSLVTSITGTTVGYQDSNNIDYNYASFSVLWVNSLTERMSFQLQPNYSWYRNQADLAVKSNTYGLQAGFLWALAEKWQFNLLAGGTQVYTVYGQGGFVQIDPDTGQIEFVEDQDSSGFVGNTTLSFTEEKYGFNANLYSRISPTGNGVLQQQNGGGLGFNWKPRERLRFDIDALGGYSTASDDRIDDGRQYWQVGTRFAYQFLKEWWVSARYRFREQESDRSNQGVARGNSVLLTVSYRLPREVF